MQLLPILLVLIIGANAIQLKTLDGRTTGNFLGWCTCCDGKSGLFCYLDIGAYNADNSKGFLTTCGTAANRPVVTGTIDYDPATGEIADVYLKPTCAPPKNPIQLKTYFGETTGNFLGWCTCCDGKSGMFCYLDIGAYNADNSKGFLSTCGTAANRPVITGTIDYDPATGYIDDIYLKPTCPPKSG